MERLTERTDIGIVGNNATVKNYPLYEVAEYDELDHGITGQCFNKLAEYEDAEEKGLLLWLPVAPNTTVYEICNNADACCECEYFEKGYCCDDYCNNKDVRNEDGETYLSFPQFADKPICEKHYLMVQPVKMTLEMIVRNMDNFGITIFKTQEEAEQKLKEMESEAE